MRLQVHCASLGRSCRSSPSLCCSSTKSVESISVLQPGVQPDDGIGKWVLNRVHVGFRVGRRPATSKRTEPLSTCNPASKQSNENQVSCHIGRRLFHPRCIWRWKQPRRPRACCFAVPRPLQTAAGQELRETRIHVALRDPWLKSGFCRRRLLNP